MEGNKNKEEKSNRNMWQGLRILNIIASSFAICLGLNYFYAYWYFRSFFKLLGVPNTFSLISIEDILFTFVDINIIAIISFLFALIIFTSLRYFFTLLIDKFFIKEIKLKLIFKKIKIFFKKKYFIIIVSIIVSFIIICLIHYIIKPFTDKLINNYPVISISTFIILFLIFLIILPKKNNTLSITIAFFVIYIFLAVFMINYSFRLYTKNKIKKTKITYFVINNKIINIKPSWIVEFFGSKYLIIRDTLENKVYLCRSENISYLEYEQIFENEEKTEKTNIIKDTNTTKTKEIEKSKN